MHVASGGGDGGLFIWNVGSGGEVKFIGGGGSASVGVVWAPSGGTVYSAERDQTVCVYGSPSSIDF
jgi:WD40 repeat protein